MREKGFSIQILFFFFLFHILCFYIPQVDASENTFEHEPPKWLKKGVFAEYDIIVNDTKVEEWKWKVTRIEGRWAYIWDSDFQEAAIKQGWLRIEHRIDMVTRYEEGRAITPSETTPWLSFNDCYDRWWISVEGFHTGYIVDSGPKGELYVEQLDILSTKVGNIKAWKLRPLTNEEDRIYWFEENTGIFVKLLFPSPGYRGKEEWILSNTNIDFDTPIQVDLPSPARSLIFIIQDDNGNPISGAKLSSTSEPNGQHSLSGSTSSDGSVKFNDIKSGSYTFRASKSEYVTETRIVSVKAGETTKITITLEKEAKDGEGILGFPCESIILGIFVGMLLLWWMRRRTS